jgi:hypothetical protein
MKLFVNHLSKKIIQVSSQFCQTFCKFISQIPFSYTIFPNNIPIAQQIDSIHEFVNTQNYHAPIENQHPQTPQPNLWFFNNNWN